MSFFSRGLFDGSTTLLSFTDGGFRHGARPEFSGDKRYFSAFVFRAPGPAPTIALPMEVGRKEPTRESMRREEFPETVIYGFETELLRIGDPPYTCSTLFDCDPSAAG